MRSWSIVDFVLIWLGGFLGAGIFLGVGQALGEEWGLLFGLAGQYLGNLAVFAYLARRKDAGEIGFRIERSDFSYIALGVFLQLMVAIAARPLFERLFPDGGSPQQISEAMSNIDTSTLLKVTFFTAGVVVAPVIEELMFRGVLLQAVVPRGRAFAIVMTAIAFTAVHIVGLDLDRPLAAAAVVLPPVFVLGLILAWVTLSTGRLGPAILLHSGWNLLAAVVLLIPNELLESVG